MKKSSLISVFKEGGFTLIEILIAITLLAFITIGVVQVSENAVNTMDRTTELNKNNLQIETAMSRFEWDFSQIYSPLYYSTVMNLQQGTSAAFVDNDQDGNDDNTGRPMSEAGQSNVVLQEYYQQLVQRFERNELFSAVSKEGMPIPRFYSPEKNTFEFFTTSNRRKIENTKQSHFAWVRYSLGEAREKDPDEEVNPNIPKSLKTLVRYFYADDPYNDKRLESGDERLKAAILLENVESLEFQFWDFNRKKWETSLKSIPQGESVLRGVKVLVTWYDSQGLKRSTERIFRNHWPMVVPQNATQTQKPAGQQPQ